MWWEILKSTRDEAYSKFLEEFGPEVDLNQIKFNDRELTQDDWLIHMDNMGDITFHSKKYRPHLGFVQGMFQEEYPERYKEIGDLLEGLILEEKEREGVFTSSEELPDFDYESEIEKWLKSHALLVDNNFPTRSAKLAIMIAIIGHYEYGVRPLDLYQRLEREQFANTNNLFMLFKKYDELMTRQGHTIASREIVKVSQIMKTIGLLLDGKIAVRLSGGKLRIKRWNKYVA